MFINSPEYPVIVWQVPIPDGYTIEVTVASVGTKRFVISEGSLTDSPYTIDFSRDNSTGDLLLYGYDVPYAAASSPRDTVARMLSYAVKKVLTSAATVNIPQGLPDGGFNYTWGVGNTGQLRYTYDGPRGLGVLGRYLELEFSSNPTGSTNAITIDFGSQHASIFGWDTQTQAFTGSGANLTQTSTINPPGMWTPDNRTLMEVRDSVASTSSTISAYNNTSYRNLTWGTNKTTMLLDIPLVYAAQIYEYRRTDTRFATPYFSVTDPNNLYEGLINAGRANRRFRIWWNFVAGLPATFEYEDFFLSDTSTLNSLNNSLEDVSDNRGKLYRVTIPFLKYEE